MEMKTGLTIMLLFLYMVRALLKFVRDTNIIKQNEKIQIFSLKEFKVFS